MTDESEKSAIERLFEWYEANVPLRVGAAAMSVPTHGASALFDAAVTGGLAYLRRRRLNQFQSELVTLDFRPTEEEVKSEEFIEAFLETASRIQQTRREEKIRLLTRLFADFWESGDRTEDRAETYEEDLAILDEIELSEFQLLFLLASFEEGFPPLEGENVAQRTSRYWKEFENAAASNFGIAPVELESYLQRISRTGLYQPVTGGFWDYLGGRGHLTGRFYRLMEKVDSRKHEVSEKHSGCWNLNKA